MPRNTREVDEETAIDEGLDTIGCHFEPEEVEGTSTIEGDGLAGEDDGYRVQCTAGHEFIALPGTKTHKRCEERELEGFLDCLTIPKDQCPICIEEEHSSLRLALDTCGDDPSECGLGTACTQEGCQLLRDLTTWSEKRRYAESLFPIEH